VTPSAARSQPLRWLVLAVAGIMVAALVGAPLVFLARGASAGGVAGVTAALSDPEVRVALGHTVSLAILVTLVAVVLGTALAVVFDRSMLRRPHRWRVAVVLPLLVPQFALTLSWTQAYAPAGLLDHLAGVTMPGLYGSPGIALVLIAEAVPLVWLIVTAGLAVRREPDLVRAARASGASAVRAFITIDLPLLRGPLVAAGAVVVVGVVNSFAVPQVLGSAQGYETLATLAYRQLSFSAAADVFTRLCVVALLMVVVVLVAVGTVDRGFGRIGTAFTRTGLGGTPFVHRRSAGARWVALGLALYLVLTTVLPLLALILTSLTRAPGLTPTPANWAWTNYSTGLAGAALTALGRSLVLAAVAALVVTALAITVVGVGGEAGRRLGAAVTLGYAVPGTALAIGVLVAYGRWLGGSAAIILVAYLGKCAALGYRAVAAGADRVPPELAQAARASGANAATVFATITARVMATGYLAAAGLVVLFALHELTMSSLLYGPGTETFAVVVLNQQQLGGLGTSAALAVILTVPPLVVAGGVAGLLAWWNGPRRDRRDPGMPAIPAMRHPDTSAAVLR
jgi:iron(III) transport system permease protein